MNDNLNTELREAALEAIRKNGSPHFAEYVSLAEDEIIRLRAALEKIIKDWSLTASGEDPSFVIQAREALHGVKP